MASLACKNLRAVDVVFGLCACGNYAFAFTFILALNVLFPDWLTSFQADRGSTTSVQAISLGFTLGGGQSSVVYLAALLPSCYRPVTTLLPSCYHPVTVLLPSCYRPVTTLLPSCYRPVTTLLPP